MITWLGAIEVHAYTQIPIYRERERKHGKCASASAGNGEFEQPGRAEWRWSPPCRARAVESTPAARRGTERLARMPLMGAGCAPSANMTHVGGHLEMDLDARREAR